MGKKHPRPRQWTVRLTASYHRERDERIARLRTHRPPHLSVPKAPSSGAPGTLLLLWGHRQLPLCGGVLSSRSAAVASVFEPPPPAQLYSVGEVRADSRPLPAGASHITAFHLRASSV